ncbi:MAG: phospho-sugar mutase [Clostridiales bacterium]|nr:phospho-sugar mutase [Clostridiales bacterium]
MGYRQLYDRWLGSAALTDEERRELEALSGQEAEIESRFLGPLEFGTAGLRGVMGLGLFRMNRYVVRHATQAFAQVILRESGGDASAAVCYDCRAHSAEFARETACVLAANGIRVRLFEAMRPTPELSFAIRHYGLTAGVNITASHNPKEYNGYKVYWSDGAQLPPEKAAAIAAVMAENDVFDSVKTMDYDEAVRKGLITLMGEETDAAFLRCVMAESVDGGAVKNVADTFKMVYTPFHGTGYRLVPHVLRELGVGHLYCVEEQMTPDGSFPTVASPNPENPESFALAIEYADRYGADFILGTDPDADRVGILVRDKNGAFRPITGNQTGVLLLDYLIAAKKRAGTLPERPVALKTIVTTELARKIAEANGVKCIDTFTGFKFMAEKKNALEAAGEGKVFFAYEESYGYMIGDFVRDKDAVTASLLLTEMAAWYAGRGMTLLDALEAIYEKYGRFAEKTLSLMMPGVKGMANMKALMDGLRATPPAQIEGTEVQSVTDYLSGEKSEGGRSEPIELKGSNVLRFELVGGTSVIVRPSGTEPKVKVYILTRGETAAECDEKIARFTRWAQALADRYNV